MTQQRKDKQVISDHQDIEDTRGMIPTPRNTCNRTVGVAVAGMEGGHEIPMHEGISKGRGEIINVQRLDESIP